MIYFILFVFGLAIGSFLNVVSLRYGKESIGGRSHCQYCLKTLRWHELIPLFSFAWQRGRCRSCLKKISWQYPIVEILSGLIFAFVPFALIASGQSLVVIIIWLIIFELFLLLSIIDFRLYIIPDSINISLAILGIVLISFNHFFLHSFLGSYARLFGFFDSSVWIRVFLGVFIVMIFYGAIIFFTRGKGMGWGDFKLIGAIGLIFSWPDALIISLLAFVIGAIAAIPILIRGKKKMKDPVPFGPFIILAATLIFFFGRQMAGAYFKLFGLFV